MYCATTAIQWRRPALMVFGACLLFSTQLSAEEEGAYRDAGFYLAASGGFQNRNRSAESDVVWTDWQSGYSLSALAGYRFNKRWRVDAEWARFKNDADVLSGGLTPDGFQLVSDASGNAVLNSFLINANVDFELHPRWTLSLGAGIGRMKSDVNNLTNDIIEGAGFIFDGESEDWVDVVQFKLGVGYAVTDNLEIFGQYRYVNADKFEFEFRLPNGLIFPAGPKDTKIDSGEIGLRYSF